MAAETVSAAQGDSSAAEIIVPPGGMAVDSAGNLADMPRDLAHSLSSDLLDVLTLMHAAAREGGELDSQGDGMTSPASRRDALIFMARDKLCHVLRKMDPYV